MKDDCIYTTGIALDKDGYPRLNWNKRMWRMNRLIFTFVNGKIPEGKVIGHKCNNKGCINPNHLYLTTAKENSTQALIDGLYFTGHHNENIKKASKDWEIICKLYFDEEMSQEKIGKIYNVSQSRISEIIKKHKHKFFDGLYL